MKISGAVLTTHSFKVCQHVNEIHKKYTLEVSSKKQLNIRFVSFIFVLKMGTSTRS